MAEGAAHCPQGARAAVRPAVRRAWRAWAAVPRLGRGANRREAPLAGSSSPAVAVPLATRAARLEQQRVATAARAVTARLSVRWVGLQAVVAKPAAVVSLVAPAKAAEEGGTPAGPRLAAALPAARRQAARVMAATEAAAVGPRAAGAAEKAAAGSRAARAAGVAAAGRDRPCAIRRSRTMGRVAAGRSTAGRRAACRRWRPSHAAASTDSGTAAPACTLLATTPAINYRRLASPHAPPPR